MFVDILVVGLCGILIIIMFIYLRSFVWECLFVFMIVFYLMEKKFIYGLLFVIKWGENR